MNKIRKNALFNALATALYIGAVAFFLSNAQKFFGPDESKNMLIPIAMLSLLVFSAALTGFLILGRPILWYLDGKKKEALSLLAWTLGAFFVITILAFLAVYLFN